VTAGSCEKLLKNSDLAWPTVPATEAASSVSASSIGSVSSDFSEVDIGTGGSLERRALDAISMGELALEHPPALLCKPQNLAYRFGCDVDSLSVPYRPEPIK
jgi:hypothetical protein